MESPYLVWLLFIPLIVSVLTIIAGWFGRFARPLMEILHLASVTVTLVLVFIVAGQVLAAGEVLAFNHWLRVDSLGALFVVIVGMMGFLAGIYSIGFTRHELSIGYTNHDITTGGLDMGRLRVFYSLFHFFLFTMLLAVTSNNIIIMWVAIEATTLSSAFLVGLYGTRPALEAAWKYVVICTVGVAFGLYGTILVYADAVNIIQDTSVASLWSEIAKNAATLDPTLLKLAFVFILIGFGTKAGIVPMHSWLPDTYSESPSPVSALLSGVLVNCTLFVVIRFAIIVNLALGESFVQTLFLVFGVLSLAAAVFFMMGQRDINRLLAYSSPENIGLILIAFGLGGPIGTLAGLLQLLNHSIVKTMMFFLSGNILMKYRSRSLDVVKGLMQAAPLTSFFLLAGVFALVGAPPFNIFFSKFLIISAGISTGHLWLMAVCMLLLMLAFTALFRMVSSVTLGEKPAEIQTGDGGFTTLAPIAILMILALALGLFMPAQLTDLLNGAVEVVNAGVTATPLAGPDGSASLLGPFGGLPVESFFSLFSVNP